MKRIFSITIILVLLSGLMLIDCKKSGKDGKDDEGDVSYSQEYREATEHLKEVYKSVFIEKDIDSDTERDARRYQTAWNDISENFKEKPPGKYADDPDWELWIEEMKVHSDRLKEEISDGNLESSRKEIREIQKLQVDLDERNNDMSAIDEIIQFDIYIDEMEKTFEEGDGDELKRTFMKLQRTLDRLFTAVTPDSAKEEESLYDDMKNELYDKLADFEQASGKSERLERLEELKETSRDFYYKFG